MPQDDTDQPLDWIVTERSRRHRLGSLFAGRSATRDTEGMRLLFCGDIVGRSGRDVLVEHMPRLRRSSARFRHRQWRERRRRLRHHREDLPASSTRPAPTSSPPATMSGTSGRPSASSTAIRACCGRRIFPTGTPGRAAASTRRANGRKVLVANLMGRLFMDPLDDPFAAGEHEPCQSSAGRHGRRASCSISMPKRPARRWPSPISRRPGLAGGRHPYPCADRRPHDPARRHRLSVRCRHVRRL